MSSAPRLKTGADVEDAGEEDAGSKASWRIGVPSAAHAFRKVAGPAACAADGTVVFI
jgi:hypothetical protein